MVVFEATSRFRGAERLLMASGGCGMLEASAVFLSPHTPRHCFLLLFICDIEYGSQGLVYAGQLSTMELYLWSTFDIFFRLVDGMVHVG